MLVVVRVTPRVGGGVLVVELVSVELVGVELVDVAEGPSLSLPFGVSFGSPWGPFGSPLGVKGVCGDQLGCVGASKASLT